MASLAKCLDSAGFNFIEKKQIKKDTADKIKSGYTQKEAQNSVLDKMLTDLNIEWDGIIAQVETKTGKKFAKIGKTIDSKIKEPKPVIKPQEFGRIIERPLSEIAEIKKTRQQEITKLKERAKKKSSFTPDLEAKSLKAEGTKAAFLATKGFAPAPQTPGDIFSAQNSIAKQNITKKYKETKKWAKAKFKKHIGIKGVGLVQKDTIPANSLYAKDADDIASLLDFLSLKAQEEVYAVSTDKNGKILQIHFYSKGSKDSASATPTDILLPITKDKSVAKVYVVHNHPSQKSYLKPSDADRAFTQGLVKLNKLSENPVKLENLIIRGNEYLQFGETLWTLPDEPIRPILSTEKKVEIAVVERQFVENPNNIKTHSILQKDRETQTKEQQTVDFINKHFSDQRGMLYLSGQMMPVGMLEHSIPVSGKQLAHEILSFAETTNSEFGIYFDNTGVHIPKERIDMLYAFGGEFKKVFALSDFFVAGGKKEAYPGVMEKPVYGTQKVVYSDELLFSEKDKLQKEKASISLKTKSTSQTNQLTKFLSNLLNQDLPTDMFVAVDPSEIDNKKRTTHKLIEDAYNKFNQIGKGIIKREKGFKYWDTSLATEISSYHKDGYLVYKPIKNIIKSGIKEVFKVVIEDDKIITTTKDHRFMTEDFEYKRLEDLKVNDVVLVQDLKKKNKGKQKGRRIIEGIPSKISILF